MPVPLTDELLQYMISQGYIVVADNQECDLKKQDEILFEFAKVPPESDFVAREMFFAWYHEALDQEYQIVGHNVYRPRHRPRRKRRR